MGRQQEVDLTGLIAFEGAERSKIRVDRDVGVAQAPARAIGDDPGQRAVIDLQVGLNTRCFFELPIDLRRRKLPLLERHVVE